MQKYKVAGLFLLLILVALVPMFITERNTAAELNKLHASALSADQEVQVEQASVSSLDHLMLIANANISKTGVTSEKEFNGIPADLQEKILSAFQKQVTLLQTNGALPMFSVSANSSLLSLTKMSFMNTQNAGKVVSVWETLIQSDQYKIFIWMDVETEKIYQYGMNINGNGNGLNLTNISFQAFADYLGFSSGQIELSDESKGFETYVVYTDQASFTYCFFKDSFYFEYFLEF